MKSSKPIKKTKKEIRKKKRKNIITFILLLIIFSTFVYIMNNRKLRLSSIEINGLQTLSKSEVRSNLDKYLSNKMFWLIPNDNIIFLRVNKIEREIENVFPKIYNVKILVRDNAKLVLDIEERKPHSLWCKNENYESSFDEECFFADQRGFIYTKAPYFSEGIFEKIYTTDNVLNIGEQVMDKEDFSIFFKFTESLLKNYGITVGRIFINDNDETRIYISSLLKYNFINKPYIVYHNDENYEIIGRNIGLMIDHNFFKKDWKKKPERLEYIDVRIPDQIRYKFTSNEEYNDNIIKQQKIKNEKNKETTE